MSIANILRNLKYNVHFDDGDVFFTDGAHTYCLECSEETDDLFFGQLSAIFEYDDIVTYDRVNQFNLSHNFKATKIIQTKNNYSFRSEFYFDDSDFIHESIGLYVSTMKKAESMLIADCQSDSEKQVVEIASIQTRIDREAIPKTINCSILVISNDFTGDTLSLFVRIYYGNTLLRNDSSPIDFSFMDQLSIFEDEQQCTLIPWELPESYDPNSIIRYEIWDNRGQCLVTNEFNE